MPALPLERCQALILNADYRPLSYFPLSVWPWQEAVKALFRETVVVVHEYDQIVRAPNRTIRLPSVLALKSYIPNTRKPAFTRFNVFLRDGFRCQYCRGRFRAQNLTFDHVIPRSRGGISSWENIVTACQSCNIKKGSRLPDECGMMLEHEPRRPSPRNLRETGRNFPPNFLHESWGDFLYWDSELEK